MVGRVRGRVTSRVICRLGKGCIREGLRVRDRVGGRRRLGFGFRFRDKDTVRGGFVAKGAGGGEGVSSLLSLRAHPRCPPRCCHPSPSPPCFSFASSSSSLLPPPWNGSHNSFSSSFFPFPPLSNPFHPHVITACPQGVIPNPGKGRVPNCAPPPLPPLHPQQPFLLPLCDCPPIGYGPGGNVLLLLPLLLLLLVLLLSPLLLLILLLLLPSLHLLPLLLLPLLLSVPLLHDGPPFDKRLLLGALPKSDSSLEDSNQKFSGGGGLGFGLGGGGVQ